MGSAVARVLLERSWKVRALIRPGSSQINFEGLALEKVHGELEDSESLRQALAGCDALFHVAADYRLWVPDPESMYRTNVDGTRHLMQLALECGIKRIVYTSSVATLGNAGAGQILDESAICHEQELIGHYKRSKWQAERLVTEMVRNQRLPAVIVNPAAPVGPRDYKPTPTGRMVLDAARGRMPAYVDTGLNIVHVDDVAYGHWLAHEHGAIGERYILGGENLSLKTILTEITRHAGVSGPRLRLPVRAVLPMAYLAQWMARLRNREPAFTVDGVRMSGKTMYFDSSRARQALGYQSRSARQALCDAVDWFNEKAYA